MDAVNYWTTRILGVIINPLLVIKLLLIQYILILHDLGFEYGSQLLGLYLRCKLVIEVVDVAADSAVVFVREELSLILSTKNLPQVKLGIACVVCYALLTLVVNEGEDVEVAKQRQLNGLLEQPLLPLAETNLPLRCIFNFHDLLYSFLSHGRRVLTLRL